MSSSTSKRKTNLTDRIENVSGMRSPRQISRRCVGQREPRGKPRPPRSVQGTEFTPSTRKAHVISLISATSRLQGRQSRLSALSRQQTRTREREEEATVAPSHDTGRNRRERLAVAFCHGLPFSVCALFFGGRAAEARLANGRQMAALRRGVRAERKRERGRARGERVVHPCVTR